MIYSLKARQLETTDYDDLVEWGKFWRFPIPPKEFLPDDGTCGLMVEDSKGRVHCAGFIYETNSKACWLEYVISNPNTKDKILRNKSITLLINGLTSLAEEWGYKWIFTSVKNPHLIKRYEDCGFAIGTKGTTEMIKAL